MRPLAALAGALAVAVLLWDAFETVVLPHRVSRRLRVAEGWYRLTWPAWRATGSRVRGRRREALLGYYGPLSLLTLVVLWAVGLVAGFALLQWGLGTDLTNTPEPGLADHLYLSGTTFFTLGFGDLTPTDAAGRVVAVAESGTGFAFLAVAVGYLPVLYQAFSRREVFISQLDVRAGSPPSAGKLLVLHESNSEDLHRWLRDAERWSAELLQSLLSHPALAYFRSQHDHESWVAALVVTLDTSASLLAQSDHRVHASARFAFAMARHAAVDLAHVIGARPVEPPDRLPPGDLARVSELLAAHGLGSLDRDELSRLRAAYEPFVAGLSRTLAMPLPAWV